jgi:hypothetical protein
MRLTPLLIVAVPAASWVLLILRLSALRKDRRGPDTFFASPFSGALLPHDLLSRDMYSTRGQRLLPWVWSCFGLLVIAAIAALGLIYRAAQ